MCVGGGRWGGGVREAVGLLVLRGAREPCQICTCFVLAGQGVLLVPATPAAPAAACEEQGFEAHTLKGGRAPAALPVKPTRNTDKTYASPAPREALLPPSPSPPPSTRTHTHAHTSSIPLVWGGRQGVCSSHKRQL